MILKVYSSLVDSMKWRGKGISKELTLEQVTEVVAAALGLNKISKYL